MTDPSEFWGSVKYGDVVQTPVPKRAARCVSGDPRHPCKQHREHAGDHRCICGKSWPRGATA